MWKKFFLIGKAASVKGPNDNRPKLGVDLHLGRGLVHEQLGFRKERLELAPAPQPLAFEGHGSLLGAQHVVEDEDEGAWAAVSCGLHGRGLQVVGGRLEERDQFQVVEVARAPPQEDACVLPLPHVALHRRLVHEVDRLVLGPQ